MKINYMDNKIKASYEEFPDFMKTKIWNQFRYRFDNIEELKDTFIFFYRKIDMFDDFLVLPETLFDFRGDGDTGNFEDLTENLTLFLEVESYSVGAKIYKKTNKEEKAFAVYLLDNREILLIEIL